jgi:Fatty acid hydroxylase superfamily
VCNHSMQKLSLKMGNRRGFPGVQFNNESSGGCGNWARYMRTATMSRETALAHGRSKKRNNALAAIVSGVVPAFLLAHYMRTTPAKWLIGVGIGLLWSNAFEYAYHRWLLHWPQSSFGRGHLLHHSTLGTPQEAAHVTFGDSPLRVTALFCFNGIPLLLLERWFRLGISPGILVGWTTYLVLVEEIHWRIHLGGWLPPGLCAARNYHLAHHDVAGGRFNVFLPVFDYLLGNILPPMDEIVLPPAAETAHNSSRAPWFLLVQETVLYLWLVILAVDRRFLSRV